MAGPEKLPQPVGLESQAAALLQLLGGTKTTTSPGDTTALQGTLAGLKGVDYEAMLKAIFQQAGSQIPGLQQALGNAIGARSGGNSAVQAALQKLLAQTSTGAMDQVAKLQAQNFQTQANVGNSIAQATQGTTKKSGTDIGTGATNLAAITAALQAAKAFGIQDLFKGSTSSSPAATAPSNVALNTSALPTEPVNYSLSSAPAFSFDSQFSTNNQLSNDYAVAPGDYSLPTTDIGSQGLQAPTDNSSPFDYQLGSYDYSLAPSGDTSLGLDYQPDYTVPDFVDYTQPFEANYSLFADGGLVRSRQGKAEGYADGGTVRAGGSRRSANPTFTPQTIDQSLARRSADALRTQFKAPVPTVPASSRPGSASGINRFSGNGSFGGSPDVSNGVNPGSFGRTVGKIGAINTLSGVTGGPTLGPAVGALGLAGALAGTKTKEEALGLVGKTALNIAAPGLGSVAGFVGNPSLANGINIAASLNPIGLGYNALAGLFGIASIGELVDNIRSEVNPNQMMTAEQEAIGAISRDNPNSADLTSQANSMPGDALGNLMGITDAFGTAPVGAPADSFTGFNGLPGPNGPNGFGGSNGFGDGRGIGGGDSSNAGGGFGGGDSRGAGDTDGGSSNGNAAAANGGLIDGPGTGTSDSIDIKVSDGETVITAETTKAVNEALGENFFLALEEAFNPKAAKAQRQLGRA